MARLHTVTGTGFGYPAEPFGPPAATWRQAFTAMMDAVLDDAERYRARLPVPPDRVRRLFAAVAGVLDDVVSPALVHFDLWEGNLLLDGEPGARTLGGVIDGERMFWGDPVADFVSLALLGNVEDDADFLSGYAAVAGPPRFDDSVRLRLALYRAYLYLIMLVEGVPRGCSPEQSARTERHVTPQLLAACGTWRLLADDRRPRPRGATTPRSRSRSLRGRAGLRSGPGRAYRGAAPGARLRGDATPWRPRTREEGPEMTNHTPEQGPGTRSSTLDTQSEEDRLRLLETHVQTLADAVRALAQGLENSPTQDDALAAETAARGARLAHELLLSQGL